MSTSRTRTRRKRTGLFDYVGNVIDDTKDFIDDVLDRGRDIDDDVRRTGRRALRADDDRDEDDRDRTEDIEELREQLDELSAAVRKLSSSGTGHNQPAKSK